MEERWVQYIHTVVEDFVSKKKMLVFVVKAMLVKKKACFKVVAFKMMGGLYLGGFFFWCVQAGAIVIITI